MSDENSFEVALQQLKEVHKKKLLSDFLKNNPQLSYQTGSAVFFGATLALVGSVLLTPAIGAPVGAAIGIAFGAVWGKRKWRQQVEKFKKADTAEAIEQIALELSKDSKKSFVEHMPVIGRIYQAGKEAAKNVGAFFETYKKNLMVADLMSGVGVAVGYEIGVMAGTLVAPGIGTAVGAVVGCAVGFVGGMVIGAKGSDYFNKKFDINYDKQRITGAGALAGAGIGAATGALLGTFIFPGVGSLVGAAVGASLGAVGGGVYAYKSSKTGALLDKFSEVFSMGPGISSGAILGSIIGSAVAPGLGTAIGALIGASLGAGSTFLVTRYGNYLRRMEAQQQKEIAEVTKHCEEEGPGNSLTKVLRCLSESRPREDSAPVFVGVNRVKEQDKQEISPQLPDENAEVTTDMPSVSYKIT